MKSLACLLRGRQDFFIKKVLTLGDMCDIIGEVKVSCLFATSTKSEESEEYLRLL